MTVQKWGLSFLLLFNVCCTQASDGTQKNKKMNPYHEEIETAQTVFYTVQLLLGALFVANIGMEFIARPMPSERIRLAGFSFIASSFLYNGFKGLFDIIKNGKPGNKHIGQSTGTLLGKASKKCLNIIYHCMEICIAGLFMSAHGYDCYRGDWATGYGESIIWIPLLTNGMLGLDHELKLSILAQKLLQRLKNRTKINATIERKKA